MGLLRRLIISSERHLIFFYAVPIALVWAGWKVQSLNPEWGRAVFLGRVWAVSLLAARMVREDSEQWFHVAIRTVLLSLLIILLLNSDETSPWVITTFLTVSFLFDIVFGLPVYGQESSTEAYGLGDKGRWD